MNELNKLIEQYETENPRKKAKIEYNGGVFYRWSTYFVKWLASRPTCLPNERAFLDEIREKGELVTGNDGKSWIRLPICFIAEEDFNTPLKELVNDTKTKAD